MEEKQPKIENSTNEKKIFDRELEFYGINGPN